MNTMLKARVWARRRFRPGAPADHAEVRLLLQLYLDSRVDEPVARRIAEHIAHCPDCSFDADTYRELKESLRRHGTPPHDVLRRIADFAEELASGQLDESLLFDPEEPGEDR